MLSETKWWSYRQTRKVRFLLIKNVSNFHIRICFRPQDLYHTCYTLSGVAIAQHSESALNPAILGDPINELMPTHPLFNVSPQAVAHSIHFYEQLNKLRSFTQLNNNTVPLDTEISEEDPVEETS